MFSFTPSLHDFFSINNKRTITLVSQPSAKHKDRYITAILIKDNGITKDKATIDIAQSPEEMKQKHNQWKSLFEFSIPAVLQDIRNGKVVIIKY